MKSWLIQQLCNPTSVSGSLSLSSTIPSIWNLLYVYYLMVPSWLPCLLDNIQILGMASEENAQIEASQICFLFQSPETSSSVFVYLLTMTELHVTLIYKKYWEVDALNYLPTRMCLGLY